jgi:NTE family protein
MSKPKIAIACQGGGSQTAFTAGVFKALFERKIQDKFEIVSLSGTSGGAICAFLIWYAIKRGDDPVWKRLIDFWEDNSASTYNEKLFNDFAIKTVEWTSKGFLPQFNVSPSSTLSKALFNISTTGLRDRFTNFEALLHSHADFDELASWGPQPKRPILLIGACNILTGKLHKFNSYYESIRPDHLLASACVPKIFPAVVIDGMAYWDGLFSDNPPINELIKDDYVGADNIPDEIWVIKINPTTCKEIPCAVDDIADRQNELEGNISLLQGLEQIEFLNSLLMKGAFKDDFLSQFMITKPIRIPNVFSEDPDKAYHIPLIKMSEDLAQSLNYESKLDRSPDFINLLIADGEAQGRQFLEDRLKLG